MWISPFLLEFYKLSRCGQLVDGKVSVIHSFHSHIDFNCSMMDSISLFSCWSELTNFDIFSCA
jgi:hypothetical protein